MKLMKTSIYISFYLIIINLIVILSYDIAYEYIVLKMSYDDLSYILPLTINHQKIDLLLDTSSSDLIVFNHSLCDNIQHHINSALCYNANNNFELHQPINISSLNLLWDHSELIDEYLLYGYDLIELQDIKYINHNDLTGLSNKHQKYSFYLSSNLELKQQFIPFRTLRYISGIIGLNKNSPLLSSSSSLLSSELTSLSLDLYPRLSSFTSKIYINGINSLYQHSLIKVSNDVDDKESLISNYYHSFYINQLEICNKILDLQTQTAIYTFIDSSSNCLSVPNHLYQQIISSLSLYCIEDNDYCYLLGNQKNLPTLTLYVNHAKAKAAKPAKPLYIGLNELLLSLEKISNHPDHANGRPLCLLKHNENYIKLGVLTLQSLFMFIELTPSYSLSLSNKLYPEQTDYNCLSSTISCQGQQIVLLDYQICIDIKCTDYFFFQYDLQHKTCQLSLSFYYLLISFIVLYILLEMFNIEYYFYLLTQIKWNYTQQQS